MLQGIPEMIALKRRLAAGFYDEPKPEPIRIPAMAQSGAK